MSRTIFPGSKGVDASFARPPAARLVELGYSFLVGYLSVPPSSPKKNLTPADRDAYLPFVCLLTVWEMSATRATLGAVYGARDGSDAKAQATLLGQPTDVPILVADDTNTTTQNVNAQEAYMRAFAAACAPYPIGIYGDVDILYRCSDLWRIGWLPNAWSWSGGSRQIAEQTARALGVHVLQHTGFYIDATWAVDPDEVIAPFPAWGLGNDPQPSQGDDDVKLASNEEVRQMPWGLSQPGTEIFVIGTRKRSVSGEEYKDLYDNGPAPRLTNAVLDAIPDEVGEAATQAPQIDYDRLAAAVAAKITVPPYLTKVTLSGTLA